METNKSIKGSVLVLALVGVILVGGASWLLSRTHWFDGDTKRANAAKETSAEIVASKNAQIAAGGAYMQVLGETNALAPDSKQKDAIAALVNVGYSYLGSADPKKRIEALELRNAILEGNLKLANSLTDSALSRGDKAIERATKAEDENRKVNEELARIAAERLGSEKVKFILCGVIGLLGLAYLWTKFTHLSPGAVAQLATDLKDTSIAVIDKYGDKHVPQLDAITSRLQQNMASFWARLKNL